ncbi:uncharacterized protein BXZ73DRAFT_99119 [Epithele typhae]|uniref:uncharacterized protein n=1 Tax=Epithele typhae TaxID=378194 RepID=UPI002007D977|nr:uncharacterized protein BXZ73DRAFT_99119 [Epithele typhae]KAH9940123.1 hypothetical protein BXZ73DRAFT_99119 [Epithele typhae]
MAILLESRTADLRVAEVFLDQVDDVADSDVLRLVVTLKSRIYEVADAIADAFRARCGVSEEGITEACRGLAKSGLLPKAFVKVLRDGNHNSNSVFAQTALQSVVTAYAHELCTVWDPSTDSITQRICEALYKSIREREPQPVAGRWRALYHTHLRALVGSEKNVRRELENKLTQWLATVLRACGVDDAIHHLRKELRRTHARDVREMVRSALELRQVVGDMVISREFAVTIVSSGNSFDNL